MERLTKKKPETNLERLLNFAIAKDKQVVLDYGFEKKPLVQVIKEKAKEMGCDVSEQAIMWEGQCMECECAVALMNMLAVQAAELHARLFKIEDILGDKYDLNRIRELTQADSDGRCVVLPCKVGDTVYWVMDRGVYQCSFTLSAFNHVGEHVFLTPEEAEKALKERENNG